MKKLIGLLGIAILCFSCGGRKQLSPEELQHKLDSVKALEIREKLKLQGINLEDASNPEKGVHPKAASLPESLGARLMLLAVDEYEGQYTIWLYSLDNEYVPVDKLCLYAVEDKEDDINPEEFVQYFSITSDYEIHLLDYSKTRQTAQSEEVYYIDDARRFALRSSKKEE